MPNKISQWRHNEVLAWRDQTDVQASQLRVEVHILLPLNRRFAELHASLQVLEQDTIRQKLRRLEVGSVFDLYYFLIRVSILESVWKLVLFDTVYNINYSC